MAQGVSGPRGLEETVPDDEVLDPLAGSQEN